MHKLSCAVATIALSVSLTTGAFAAVPSPELNRTTRPVHQSYHKADKCGLENFIRTSLKKHNGDLAKVKADVAGYLIEKKALHQARLAVKAKEKGMSVEALQAEIQQKRQAKLEAKAKEMGITAAELKKRMTERHEQRLDNMAQDLGLTREQLKQVLPAHWMEKH